MRIGAIILLALALDALGAAPARAQSCSFGITDVDFGTVDILAGAAVDTAATFSISRTGLPLNTVRVCASIGTGSGGATAAAGQLQGPTATLNYQLYQDATRTVVWGSNYWGLPGTPPTIDIPLGLGAVGNTNVTIYARLFGAQTTAPPGAYTSSFTAAHDVFDFGYTFLGIVGCDAIPLLPQSGTTTFAATATINDNCEVSAMDIDFGAQGIVTTNVDATGQVSVTCTNGTPYTVALDGGLAAAPLTARKMSKGAETITYGIYQDAGRSQPWGDTGGTTASGNGTGAARNLVTYGRVPPQTTPSPGSYTDTVVMTVAY
jgi:spore coat protein U-like protein